MYAVIEDGSHQYRVEVGQKLDVDYRESLQPAQELVFERVLLCRTADGIHVGQPTVQDARVVARVIDHVKGPKIYVEKFKRRKNYRRRKGHRQWATRVVIERIEIGGVVVAGPVVKQAIQSGGEADVVAEGPATSAESVARVESEPAAEPAVSEQAADEGAAAPESGAEGEQQQG